MEQQNVQLVQQVYAAIGRGDIPAVVAMMTDDVEARFPGPSRIPFAGTYRGRDGVGRFFQAIGANAEVHRFEPQEFIAEGDQVVVLGRERLTAKPTNGSWESDWAMVWTVRDGKVSLLREFHETYAIAHAFAPEGSHAAV